MVLWKGTGHPNLSKDKEPCRGVWVLLLKMMWKLSFKKCFENTYLNFKVLIMKKKKSVWYYIFNNIFSKVKKHNCVFGLCVCVCFFF